jgi:hypothetical protein
MKKSFTIKIPISKYTSVKIPFRLASNKNVAEVAKIDAERRLLKRY